MQEENSYSKFLGLPLPSNSEGERVVLGSILIDNSIINQAIEQLTPDDFYVPFHRAVFLVMIKLFERGAKIDPILIGEELKKEGKLESYGGVAAIANLTDNLPHFNNIFHFAKLVSEKSLSRDLIRTAYSIVKDAFAEDEEAEIVLDRAKRSILTLAEKKVDFDTENELQEDNISLNAIFDFPEEIRIPCEQYLLYFAQFLKDSGINATSNIKEKAGRVLFSVTPTDNLNALDKIREALAVYLNLPSSPVIYDESFAAMRLQQQIENLQHSQKIVIRELQLAERVIALQSETVQEKNLIISQKDSIIEQQNKVIEKISSKSVMMDSLENKEELEEICDGLKIGQSKFLKEQLGIHINPATFIKTGVKNIFGKEERKSILGLDEKTNKENN